jgi:hypothetical protein
MKNILLLLVLLFSLNAYAVSFDNHFGDSFNKQLLYKNRRAKYPIGVNIMAFGPAGVIGLSIDWFIKPKLNLEFGIGADDFKTAKPAYFIGGKYHLFGNTLSNTTPYFGVFDKISSFTNEINHQLYVPIGLQRIKKSKFTWNIEVAYVYNINSYTSSVWGAFKIGWRFNRFNKK